MVVVSEPTLLLRALKGPELACLLALTLSGEPVRVSWLGRVTGLSPHTLTGALNTLQVLGLAQDDGQRSGWHLAASLQAKLLARAEALPIAGECLDSSPPAAGKKSLPPAQPSTDSHLPDPDEIHPQMPFSATAQSGASQVPGLALPVLTDDIPLPPVQPGGDANRGRANCRAADRGDLKEGEEDRFSLSPPDLDSLDSNPRELPSPLEPPGPDSCQQVERILAATAGLFGEPVHGPPSRYPDPRRLLAVIAHIHARRRGLRKPARVVYTMLRDGILPPEQFLADPLAHLPVDYLRAAGLPVPEEGSQAGRIGEADSLGWDETLSIAYSHDGKLAGAAHVSLSLPVRNGVSPDSPSASRAWQIAVEAIREDMPRREYEQYLHPARLVRFEKPTAQQGGCVFTVQAQDEFSRQWLTQRLTRSLTRTLEGICRCTARVEFV